MEVSKTGSCLIFLTGIKKATGVKGTYSDVSVGGGSLVGQGSVLLGNQAGYFWRGVFACLGGGGEFDKKSGQKLVEGGGNYCLGGQGKEGRWFQQTA